MTIPTLDCCCDPPPGPEPRFTMADPSCALFSPLTGWIVTFAPESLANGTTILLPFWGAGVTTVGNLAIVAYGSPPYLPAGNRHGELTPSSSQSVRLYYRVTQGCTVVSGVSVYSWSVELFNNSTFSYSAIGTYKSRVPLDYGTFDKQAGGANYLPSTIDVARRP